MITPSETRERVCGGIYRSVERGSPLGELDEVMRLAIDITPLEKKIRRGIKEGKISAPDAHGQIDQAVAAAVLTEEEGQRLREAAAGDYKEAHRGQGCQAANGERCRSRRLKLRR
jgi:acyl-CoA dehydrogenase